MNTSKDLSLLGGASRLQLARTLSLALLTLSTSALAGACSSVVDTPTDAGTVTDGGTADLGVPADLGQPVDLGHPVDLGSGADAGTLTPCTRSSDCTPPQLCNWNDADGGIVCGPPGPGTLTLGAACVYGDDCTSHFCLSGARTCSFVCAADVDCTGGTTCVFARCRRPCARDLDCPTNGSGQQECSPTIRDDGRFTGVCLDLPDPGTVSSAGIVYQGFGTLGDLDHCTRSMTTASTAGTRCTALCTSDADCGGALPTCAAAQLTVASGPRAGEVIAARICEETTGGSTATTTCGTECTSAGGTCVSGGCVMNCAATGTCAGVVTCPPTTSCLIECGAGECAGGVDCAGAASCTVVCSGANSCAGPVTCDATSCDISCTGAGACAGGVITNGVSAVIDCSPAGNCPSVSCSGVSCQACCGSGSCSAFSCSGVTCDRSGPGAC